MMRDITKRLFPSAIIAVIGASVLHVGAAHAQGFDFGVFELGNILNLGVGDPRIIIIRLINAALEFIGIITLVIILWGGFQFMISGGNDEKVKRAGATIRNAIIGLIIVILSWSIVRFVITEFVAAIDDERTATEEVITVPDLPKSPL